MNLGIDIVSTKRIRITKKFIIKVLHPKEIIFINSLANNKAKREYLAGRWAAKEAIFKCLSKKNSYSKILIELENDKLIVRSKSNIIISISHEKKYCVAVAIEV